MAWACRSQACTRPAQPRHRHPVPVADRRVDPDPRVGRRHLLDRAHHPQRATEQIPHALLGFGSPARDQPGAAEGAVDVARQRDELVDQDPAADETVDPVPEVVGGHRRTGSDQVLHHVVEDPDRAAVHVPLQVPADLIGPVAQAGGLTVVGAVQQQPRRLHRTAGRPRPPRHRPRVRQSSPGRRPADQGHPDHPTPTVDDQSLRPGLQQDLRPTGRERPRQHGVLPTPPWRRSGRRTPRTSGSPRTPPDRRTAGS